MPKFTIPQGTKVAEAFSDFRTNLRSSYAGYDLYSPWDALQVGYFLSYGMWNYLTTPFLLTYPGVQAREISPWQEDGQTWRRLHVTFPAEEEYEVMQAAGLLPRLGLLSSRNTNDQQPGFVTSFGPAHVVIFGQLALRRA